MFSTTNQTLSWLWVVVVSLGLAGIEARGSVELSVVRDVTYETPTGWQKMDIYLPNLPPSSPRVPCIIWIHGAGNDKADPRDRSICEDLALAGFVAASINYEPHHAPTLQGVMACKSAVRFIRGSADRYHVDERSIAVAGGSLGGTLALLVGFTGHESRFELKDVYPGVSDRVRAAISLCGPTDWLKMPPLGPQPPELKERLRLLSPVIHVAADSPAVFMIHGITDKHVAFDQSVVLGKRLAKFRVPHQLVLLDRVGHVFDLRTANGRPLPVDVKRAVVDFLWRHLSAPE
jgi:acetyl esterase/lipase